MKRATPLWRGPELDGITFSMLSKFLVCRERFRIQVMDGIRANYGFEHRAEYGNLFHVCVESFAAFKNVSIALNSLKKYVSQLLVQHPMHKQDVSKWYQVCAKQFPIYVEYWKNTEEKYRTPLVQERVFDVEYVLPSGDKVRLRGKFDGVDLMEIPNDISIKLGESKTKGDVDQSKIQKQLLFDLQTMMYLTVLTQDTGIREIEAIKEAGVPVTGVRYNVVRRPLSGGKGTIVRHKGTKTKAEETEESYYNRLAEYISAEPESYFMRWTSEVQPHDIKAFRLKTLDPLLQQVCDWWEWVGTCYAMDKTNYFHPDGRGVHWVAPFGTYNSIQEGGTTDIDEYMATGSMVGMKQIDNLYPELS